MPSHAHTEKHFTAGEAVRDVVIGMADGLTVPFALAAGLSGAIAQADLIITAGLAEIAGGSIAMGLGGVRCEEYEVLAIPEEEAREVQQIFATYGLTAAESESVIASLRQRPQDWVKFMMRFELGLEPPQPGRAWKSAVTIASAYIVGGLIPLAAYWYIDDVQLALRWSACTTLLALAVFGAVKGRFTGVPWLRGALQTTVVGGLAAAAAFAIARAIG
jgi:VIT1/CCC1 family predicted Fe2+/Mn2+ transporter